MRQPRMWVSVTCGAILCAAWGTMPAFAYRDNISYSEQPTGEQRQAAEPGTAETATSPSSEAMSSTESAAPQTRTNTQPTAPATTRATTAQPAPVMQGASSNTGKQNNNISSGNDGAARRRRSEAARTSITGKYKGARTNKWRELALSRHPDALDQLLHALQYYPGVSYSTPNSIRTRRQAAEALGVLGDPAALRALEDALNDPDFLVRQHAAQSIAIITERNR